MVPPKERVIGWREGALCAALPVLIEALSSFRIAEMRQPDGLILPRTARCTRSRAMGRGMARCCIGRICWTACC